MLEPPLPLEGLPATQEVWSSFMAFQKPLTAQAALVRKMIATNRFIISLHPNDPSTGQHLVRRARGLMSAHQTLHHHAMHKAYDHARAQLIAALAAHPSNDPFSNSVLKIRPNARLEVIGGTYTLKSQVIQWMPGKVSNLLPLFDVLAQYERLQHITPVGELRRYSFIQARGNSTGYFYDYGVDAADAALRLIIGNGICLFHGAELYDRTTPGILATHGSSPAGEENWVETAIKRASEARLSVNLP